MPVMETRTVDAIIENLFYVLPIVHKKLLRIDLEGIGSGLSRLHLAIMRVLFENKLPISGIAEQLLIPRPQMTHLIDHLVKMGIVERQPDDEDRRVINIVLTDTGKEVLNHCKKLVRENMRKKLSALTEDELEKLATSLEKLREIGARFK